MKECFHLNYASDLGVKETTEIRKSASYNTFFVIDKDERLQTGNYEKRDDFVHFQFLGIIPLLQRIVFTQIVR